MCIIFISLKKYKLKLSKLIYDPVMAYNLFWGGGLA